ncbi:MAG TPA: M17 family metallopeptidase [Steroidobacteraceae bacterium]
MNSKTISLLPPESDLQVTARPLELSEAAVARADGAVLLLEKSATPAKALAGLPHAGLWQALYAAQSRGGQDAPILVTRLPNRRHTLAVVGFVKPGASGFERLALAGKLAGEVSKPGMEVLQLHAPGAASDAIRIERLEALLSAVLAHAVPMPEWKSKPTAKSDLRRISIASGPSAAYDRSIAIAAGNHLARWLATLPPNHLDTLGYRQLLQQLARREGWSFRFYDMDALEKLGAGAFLAVARANPHRGAGIARLTYRPRRKAGKAQSQALALVGKGICFDTGGINLKPHKSMFMMHGDMQGSAVAVGTLLALSRLDAAQPIDCWLAITENEIGPTAFRPQEVVRAANGVTIQVVHSDAEGRMVLADTLALASREKPRLMIDFATLTGACVVAITDRYAGAFTNRPDLHDWLQRTGRDSGERVWCFPMDEDFDAELESKVADIQQCTPDSKGDHILAARFLGKFVEATVPWVHVDLAASEHKGGLAHVPTEFTGFGVRYAVHLLGDAAALHATLQAPN